MICLRRAILKFGIRQSRREQNEAGNCAISAPGLRVFSMEPIERIKACIETAFPEARIEIVRNEAPSAQHSLLVHADHAAVVAKFLRDEPALRFDYCSNVTGVDW